MLFKETHLDLKYNVSVCFLFFFGGGDIYHLLGRGVPTTFSTHCSSNAEAEASHIRLRGIQ